MKYCGYITAKVTGRPGSIFQGKVGTVQRPADNAAPGLFWTDYRPTISIPGNCYTLTFFNFREPGMGASANFRLEEITLIPEIEMQYRIEHEADRQWWEQIEAWGQYRKDIQS